MKCPYCFHADSKVVDSRDSSDLDSTRRRRECLKCSKRFTTYERTESVDMFVLKKDGRRELFNRDKIKNGILKACEKRPVSLENIEKVVNEIEIEMRKADNNEISSKDVGEIVMKKLRKLDKVAYVRFASVYKEFTDLDSFEKEVHSLLKKAQ